MCSAKVHVRFTPKSGHVRCTSRCPLSANSGQIERNVLRSISSKSRFRLEDGPVVSSTLMPRASTAGPMAASAGHLVRALRTGKTRRQLRLTRRPRHRTDHGITPARTDTAPPVCLPQCLPLRICLLADSTKCLKSWRSREEFEPPTFGLGNRCSILLSYGTVIQSQWVRDRPFFSATDFPPNSHRTVPAGSLFNP